MRGLIRAGLFAIAKLGLALSIGAYVASQYVGIIAVAGRATGSSYVMVTQYGWDIGCPATGKWEIDMIEHRHHSAFARFFGLPTVDSTSAYDAGTWTHDEIIVDRLFPGCHLATDPTWMFGPFGRLTIRHWLAIVVSIGFYAGLRFTFRMPSSASQKGPSCET